MKKFNILTICSLIILLLSCSSIKRDVYYCNIKGETGISGRVKHDDKYLKDVEVYLYRNTLSNLRGPADFMSLTDDYGKYFIDVPEGAYYIVARKRMNGASIGPLKQGDYYSDLKYEPVIVEKGKTSSVDIELRMLYGMMIQKKSGQQKTDTYISGRLVDMDGKPISGAYAFAYIDEDFKREPDYFSTESDIDGAFTLYFDKGGRFFLGGRSSTRGEPKAGDYVGYYEGTRGRSIFIKDNESVKEIKIVLQKIK